MTLAFFFFCVPFSVCIVTMISVRVFMLGFENIPGFGLIAHLSFRMNWENAACMQFSRSIASGGFLLGGSLPWSFHLLFIWECLPACVCPQACFGFDCQAQRTKAFGQLCMHAVSLMLINWLGMRKLPLVFGLFCVYFIVCIVTKNSVRVFMLGFDHIPCFGLIVHLWGLRNQENGACMQFSMSIARGCFHPCGSLPLSCHDFSISECLPACIWPQPRICFACQAQRTEEFGKFCMHAVFLMLINWPVTRKWPLLFSFTVYTSVCALWPWFLSGFSCLGLTTSKVSVWLSTS